MSECPIRVLLADDHVMFAEGLKKLLEPPYEVVGIVTDGRVLVETAEAERPDVVVTAVTMPELDGIDACGLLRDLVPETRVMILSMHTDPAWAQAALDAGAAAYLLKSGSASELLFALDQVCQGHLYVTPSLTRAMVGGGEKAVPGVSTVVPAATVDASAARIRVLVVDDQSPVRLAVRSYLGRCDDIEVVGEAKNGREGMEMAVSLAPDVILMDMTMPEVDGTEATREILGRGSESRILLLTTVKKIDRILAAIHAGALGYLPKDGLAELAAAVRQVHRGEPWLPPAITRALLEGTDPPPSSSAETLTERELEIVHLVARGFPNKDIAEQLFISEVTVRTRAQRHREARGPEPRRARALRLGGGLGRVGGDRAFAVM